MTKSIKRNAVFIAIAILLVAICLVVLLTFNTETNTANAATWDSYFGGGTGTASDPYLIYNAEQLQNIAKTSVYQGSAYEIRSNFKLMADVTLGSFWVPLYDNFWGTFDGNHHTISNMIIVIKDDSSMIYGMFETIQDTGVVKDLTINDLNIAYLNPSGYNGIGGFVGGIAGLNYGQIYNCSVSGTIDADMYNAGVGGIVGSAFTGMVSYCESNVDIYGTANLGGIVGILNGKLVVYYCTNRGSINYKFNKQSGCAAGIVGKCIKGTISYNTNVGKIIYFGEKSDSSSIKPCMAQIVGWSQAGTLADNVSSGSSDFSKLTSSQATYCTNGAVGRTGN